MRSLHTKFKFVYTNPNYLETTGKVVEYPVEMEIYRKTTVTRIIHSTRLTAELFLLEMQKNG